MQKGGRQRVSGADVSRDIPIPGIRKSGIRQGVAQLSRRTRAERKYLVKFRQFPGGPLRWNAIREKNILHIDGSAGTKDPPNFREQRSRVVRISRRFKEINDVKPGGRKWELVEVSDRHAD